jgi:Uma2 family endonuclease
MSLQPQTRISPEEYLALERKAVYKSEYLHGEIFPMPGASREHNLICVNITISLGIQLRQSSSEIYAGDMRLKVSSTGLYTSPDVIVVCDEPQFEDVQVDTLLNPTLIVEVLSPSTEDYDRGSKFEHYRTLLSLQEYLLVARDRCHIVHYLRQTDGTWLLSETARIAEHLPLPSIGCTLSLSEVYARVHFTT